MTCSDSPRGLCSGRLSGLGVWHTARYSIHLTLSYSSKFSWHNISWISWFEFWSRKFSIIVSVATFCVHMRIASAIVRTCTHAIYTSRLMNAWTVKWSIESLLTMYRLCTLTFRKWAKDTYQICKDICPNNILHLVSNPPTTTLKKWPNRQGAEGRKRGQYKSCLVLFSSRPH